MAAEPIKTLELHYTMIQFFIILNVTLNTFFFVLYIVITTDLSVECPDYFGFAHKLLFFVSRRIIRF